MDETTVIRPSAVVSDASAKQVLGQLEHRDVGKGGVWSASPGIWQRYDVPWNGTRGMRGDSKLLGTIGVIYGTPSKYDITIYRVTITEHGRALGWTVDKLCDAALEFADLTLAKCPRTALDTPAPDPFRKQ